MAELTRCSFDLGLSNIQVGKLIGGGGYSRVYRGYDSLLRRDLAIKILRPLVGHDARAAFENEAGIHGPLSRHPNVVSIYHAGFTLDGAHPYLVMDLVRGGSLGQYLHHHDRIPFDHALSWMIPVCSAVQHVHDSGVLHRDIKPDNILLEPPSTPLLSDLGIACLDTDAEPVEAMSLPHVAPEGLRGERREAPSDVFSLGATLYQLIAGRAPFGHSLEERLSTLGRCPPPLPAVVGAPPALDDILGRALVDDPSQRIATAWQLQSELEACLHGRPVLAPAVTAVASGPAGVIDTRPPHPSSVPANGAAWSAPHRPDGPVERRRRLVAGVFGLAAGVIMLALLTTIPGGQQPTGTADSDPANPPGLVTVGASAGASDLPFVPPAEAPGGRADPSTTDPSSVRDASQTSTPRVSDGQAAARPPTATRRVVARPPISATPPTTSPPTTSPNGSSPDSSSSNSSSTGSSAPSSPSSTPATGGSATTESAGTTSSSPSSSEATSATSGSTATTAATGTTTGDTTATTAGDDDPGANAGGT